MGIIETKAQQLRFAWPGCLEKVKKHSPIGGETW